MSGGFFEYKQTCIKDIADSIDSLVRHSSKTRNELHESGIDKIGEWYSRPVDWWHPVKTLAELAYWRDPESLIETKRRIEEHNREVVINYSRETLKEFKKAVTLLYKAAIYVQRIDWLLSGDDCENNFHERLTEELDALKKHRR